MSEPEAALRAVATAALAPPQVLDLSAGESFERVADLASLLFGVRHARVTVVDGERSWHASGNGSAEGDEAGGQQGRALCQEVVETGEPLVVADARTGGLATALPPQAGVVAWAGHPILSPSGEVLGAVCVSDLAPRSWTDHDLLVLKALSLVVSSELATRASLDREHAARAEAEVAADLAEVTANTSATLAATLLESRDRMAALAATLRQSLLPSQLPEVPGLEVAASFTPAVTGEEVLGDFFDIFESGWEDWAVLLGDVSGKGPGAASVTAMARYTLRAAAMRSARPSAVLATLNDAMLHQLPDDGERFLTIAYGSLRHLDGKVVVNLCSAGHLPPLVKRADGPVEEACAPCLPLGLFEDALLVDTEVVLGPGDALVLYSDGVTEARRGRDELGSDRLRAVVGDAATGIGAAGLVAHVAAAVTAFRDGPPRDDTAVLVVRVPG